MRHTFGVRWYDQSTQKCLRHFEFPRNSRLMTKAANFPQKKSKDIRLDNIQARPGKTFETKRQAGTSHYEVPQIM